MIKRTSVVDKSISVLDSMKALDIQVLDVRSMTDITDWLIIATGNSSRHVKSVVKQLTETLKKEQNLVPIGCEGEDVSEWILVDYGDFIVHVMQASIRDFYSLEALWSMDGGGSDLFKVE